MRIPIAMVVSLILSALVARAGGPMPAPVVFGAPDSTFDLSGVALEEATDRPMASVLIVVESDPPRRATTDAHRGFEFRGVLRGEYTVSARRIGYFVERREIDASCPMVVVDSAGRQIGGGGPCQPQRQRLTFLMRPHTVR